MNLYVRVQKDVKIFVEDLTLNPNQPSEHVFLFIHGWPLNHNMWEYQIEELTQLGYRCISVDLRGFGKSDRPVYGYDYNTMASDIKAVIDTLKLTNVILVGHSMGAAIAIRYMANYKGYGVSKLCLLSSAAPSFVQTSEWQNGLTPEQIDKLLKMILTDRPNSIPLIKDMTFYRYLTDPTKTWFDFMCLEASGWGVSESLIALSDEKLFDDLAQIEVPTLILHGVYDYMCPYENAIYLHEHVKNSQLLPLEESGNGAFLEEKEKINNALNLFIRGKLLTNPSDEEEPGHLIEKYTFL